jgi:hypothetical protein
MANVRRMGGGILFGLLVVGLVACGGTDTQVKTSETEAVAQSVPEALLQKVAQAMGTPGNSEMLGFFPQGELEGGHERFMVIRKNLNGEARALVVYDHEKNALWGCADKNCERRSMTVAFMPVESERKIGGMSEPSPACFVAFYMDANYRGSYDCYYAPPPPYAGIWYLNVYQVFTDDAYSSHKTYDHLCYEQGISSNCTYGPYKVDVRSVKVYKHSYYSGYDKRIYDTYSDFDDVHWCGLCGDIDNKISSFYVEVNFYF